MRITIDTDDKGNVNIDTGDKDTDKPGLIDSTTGVRVIDAGPAPIQEIERLRKGLPATEVSSAYASQSPEDREEQLPLNPLRAGAAAAYESPANLRKRPPAHERPSVAHDPSSINTMDGGSARMPADKESSGGQ